MKREEGMTKMEYYCNLFMQKPTLATTLGAIISEWPPDKILLMLDVRFIKAFKEDMFDKLHEWLQGEKAKAFCLTPRHGPFIILLGATTPEQVQDGLTKEQLSEFYQKNPMAYAFY
ncbi:MAG: hypothetical protein FWC79_00660 [Oscillospiraceae bacterium]|nr:hypothetical protein [Oscillospiraceae bacterium]